MRLNNSMKFFGRMGLNEPTPVISFINERAILTASNPESKRFYGNFIDISGDGNTVVVSDTINNSGPGKIYILVKSGTTWVEQASFSPSASSSNIYDRLNVKISNDGNTVVSGSFTDNVFNDLFGEEEESAGSVYVFTRSGTTWSQQATILPILSDFDVSYNGIGFVVTISGNGNTLMVSYVLPREVHVYVRSGITWSRQTILTETGNSDSLSLSEDGNTVLISDSNANVVRVFVRSGTTWTQQATLITTLVPNDTQIESFGSSVSLSDDGNIALVGADRTIIAGNRVGSAHIFTRSGTTWVEQAKLISSIGQHQSGYGFTVALSGNGNTAIVGARETKIAGISVGAVFAYTKSGTDWIEQAKIAASDGALGDTFGREFGISNDGISLVVAATRRSIPAENAGAAYFFEL